ncbi:hypothetical protein [Lysobacter claricitrinus]|uniref:hypothetical protein n=1 Tax=Lysobacter claricitrinus TaxID=3367728 RepID=UPI0037DAF0C7
MDKLLALFAFIASLAGWDGHRDTVVHRIVGAGADVMFSRATVQDGVARFDCVRSASGTCHYLVLPRGCPNEADCATRVRRYDVASGESRQVTGLHAFRLCVSASANGTPPCSASDTLGN